MPVTELAFLPSKTPGQVPPALWEKGSASLDIQDEWFAAHAPALPRGREGRGAALYRQVDGDPGVVLVTAHWESAVQHREWIASPENARAFPPLLEFVEAEGVVLFHVDGVEMFPASAEGDGGLERVTRTRTRTSTTKILPTLRAPFVSVARMSVATGEKGAFGEAFARVKDGLDGVTEPCVHRGGWKIEKEAGMEGVEEFVLVGGWESKERLGGFGSGKDFEGYLKVLMPAMVGVDVKMYERVV